MDIYSYAGFAYGLTALISLGTIGLVLVINSLMNGVIRYQAKCHSKIQKHKSELCDKNILAS